MCGDCWLYTGSPVCTCGQVKKKGLAALDQIAANSVSESGKRR